MRSIVAVLILLAAPALFGQQRLGDTLWVVRLKAPARDIQMGLLPGWSMVSANPDDPDCRKVNITCRAAIRDSAGKVVALRSGPRLLGVDTSRLEIKYTTVDSLPSGYGLGEWVLAADGRFARRAARR